MYLIYVVMVGWVVFIWVGIGGVGSNFFDDFVKFLVIVFVGVVNWIVLDLFGIVFE